MSESTTSICNMALKRIGSARINDYADASDNKPEAVYCRLYFEQAAKALMEDHFWPFAKRRVQLSEDTTDPAFGYENAFLLPNDFLRIICFWGDTDLPGGRTTYSYEIEGNRLLTDEDEVYLKYVRWVSSIAEWDPLFIECMVLTLAKKLAMALSQNVAVKQDVDNDLAILMRKVRAMDRNEEERIGQFDRRPWKDARYSDTP